jgi:hypothetical protein
VSIDPKKCRHVQVDIQAKAFGMAKVRTDEPAGLVIEMRAYCLECGMRFRMPDVGDTANLEEPWVAAEGFEINIPVFISDVPAVDKKQVN